MDVVTLDDYINDSHDGNLTAAAKQLDVNRTSVYQWIYKGAIYVDGIVYIPAQKRVKIKRT